MHQDSHAKVCQKAIDRQSRSAISRASGAFSRWMTTTSRLQATRRFLRQQIWAWPIVAAVLFGVIGWWVHRSVENAMREQRAMELNAFVDASATAVRAWMGEQKTNVKLVAEDEQLLPLVKDLLRPLDGTPSPEAQLARGAAQNRLRARLGRRAQMAGFVGYFVVSPSDVVVAADQDAPIGKTVIASRQEMFRRALAGEIVVCLPYRCPLLLLDEKGEPRANLPTMFAIGPLRDEQGKPIAALGLRIRPEDHFTRIVQASRFGDSGETYAFDKSGLMLSQSRFDDEMKQLGLLADQPDARSILTIEVRDPQVNMHEGRRPALRRSEQPLTRLALAAVAGQDGFDPDGYRDYRGVPSVGAWRWLPDYDFGLATEIDLTEAFRPVYILRRAFWMLMALLMVLAIGIFFAMLFMARQQKALQRATLAARQLGQYSLEQKLGAGGMGTVYRARHAMLCRPTAVKLLNADRLSGEAVGRFEREVQLTSALTHPNTVAIFDYGRTPDGIFYYAMEYLDGMNLEELVKSFGPLPEARIVYILRQVCGALAEAHAGGLVHRDIKPANIFLTCRGGLRDFVKVLDFGLVKARAGQEQAHLTSPNEIMGTPLYMSPEAITNPDTVDARADVYALGAVGYFLLTGSPVFSAPTLVEICLKQVEAAPEPPSVRNRRPVSADLEKLILRCLAKAPSDRPRSAAELLSELERCTVEGAWTAADAVAWWAAFDKGMPAADQAETITVSSPQNVGTQIPQATVAQPKNG